MGLLVGLAGLGWLHGHATVKPVRLAVLRFDQIGVEPGREYLAEGLAEDTIVSLGMIDPTRLTVVGRTSTLRYKGTTKSLKEIGAQLASTTSSKATIVTDSSAVRCRCSFGLGTAAE